MKTFYFCSYIDFDLYLLIIKSKGFCRTFLTHRNYDHDYDYVYYKNGKKHRADGAAAFNIKGEQKEYWLNDKFYPNINSDEKWLKYQKLMVFE